MTENALNVARQMLNEDEAVLQGIERYRETYRRARLEGKDLMEVGDAETKLLSKTLPKLSEAIVKHIATAHAPATRNVVRAIRGINPDELAYITIRFCFNNHYHEKTDDFGVRTARTLKSLADNLGAEIRDHVDYLRFKKATKTVTLADGTVKEISGETIINHMAKDWVNPSAKHRATAIKTVRHKEGIEDSKWDSRLMMHVGLSLIRLYVETCGIFELAKFSTSNNNIGHTISLTNKGLKLMEKYFGNAEVMKPRFKPMVCSPKPWVSPTEGGYLLQTVTNKSRLLRSWDKAILRGLYRAHNAGQLDNLYTAVNALQDTPWKINKAILKVAQGYRAAGTGMMGLPDYRKPEELCPPKPWSTDEEFETMKKARTLEFRQYMAQSHEVYKQNANDMSERRATDSILEIAKDYVEEECFWFPYNLDWRGRTYPIPVFLQPQGSDLARGLLQFGRGKKLGKTGARWLAIHGANVYGIDKVSLDDRVKWVTENQGAILGIATDPFNPYYLDWLNKADKPFQFLAFCFEWLGHIRDGENHVSYLPIQMDGSCNGPQHMAAMSRDIKAGAKVCLVPSDKPNDLYSEVAEVVKVQVQKDMVEGNPCAKEVHGRVDRKLVKRNTMTYNYGATLSTFRKQLDAELKGKADFQVPKHLVSNYLAIVNRDAIEQLLPGMAEVKKYLQNVARTVARDANRPLCWTSPIGLPVRQARWNKKRVQINTMWGSTRIQLDDYKNTKNLNPGQMSNGSSPNFVHSYDASHLFFTVLECRKYGIEDFSMIHDSYGVHACDIETMNECLRRVFVTMYLDINVLDNFRREVIKDLPEAVKQSVLDIPMPDLGDLDIRQVLHSDYFFA